MRLGPIMTEAGPLWHPLQQHRTTNQQRRWAASWVCGSSAETNCKRTHKRTHTRTTSTRRDLLHIRFPTRDPAQPRARRLRFTVVRLGLPI